MPFLSNFGSSRSMIWVPLKSMVTWSPLAVMTKSFQSPFLTSASAFSSG